MNAYRWPAFEKRLRSRVKRELKKDKSAWKEYKRSKSIKSSQGQELLGIWPWLMPWLIFTYLAILSDFTRTLPILNRALVLYLTGSALRRAHAYVRGLYAAPERFAMIYYPISDRKFAQSQFGGVREVVHLFLVAGPVYLFEQFHRQPWSLIFSNWPASVQNAGAALAAAALVSAAAVAFGYLLAIFRPTWQLGIVGWILTAAAILNLLWIPFLDQIGWNWFLLFPAGWINMAFELGWIQGQTSLLLLALPAVVLFAALPAAFRRLHSFYSIREFWILQGFFWTISHVNLQSMKRQDRAWEGWFLDSLAASTAPEQSEQLDKVQDGIRERVFLQRADWGKLPFMERVIGSWLSERERSLVEILNGEYFDWTRTFKRCAVAAVLAVVVLYAYAALKEDFILWLLAPPAAYAAIKLVPGITPWPGMKSLPCGGKFIPMFAFYPLGYSQISRVFLTVSLLRALFHAPIILCAGAAIALIFNASPIKGMAAATSVIALTLAAQPALAACHLVGRAKQAEHMTIRSFLLLIVPILLGVSIFLAAGAVTILLPGIYSVLAGIGAVFASIMFWYYCKFLFNGRSLDLVRDFHSGQQQ